MPSYKRNMLHPLKIFLCLFCNTLDIGSLPGSFNGDS